MHENCIQRQTIYDFIKGGVNMSTKDGVHKPGSVNSIQKGMRRQKLHSNQNNVGNPKNPPKYENFNNEPIQ